MHTHIIDFRRLERPADLAQLIGCRDGLVDDVLAGRPGLYHHHRLPKRNGSGFRDVWEAKNDELRDALKALVRRLDAFLSDVLDGFPDEAAHGYVRGRSIRTNAEAHLGAKRLVQADIKKFFPSITRARLEAYFREREFTAAGAEVLARFVTIFDSLPLGLHTSPILANAVCLEMDRDLRGLSAPGRYTRYADDLTFSGAVTPTRIEVQSVLELHGFQLSREKFREPIRGQGLYVTGLSIEDPEQPHVSRHFKRRLRQELFYASKFGLDDHLGRRGYSTLQSGINKIHGRIQFLRGIERALGDTLNSQWAQTLKAANESPSFLSRKDGLSRDVLFVIDESELALAEGSVLAVACVAIEDAEYVRGRVKDHLHELLLDPFVAGRKAALEKRGLHWSDLTEEMRSGVVKLMASVPARVFVAYGVLHDPAEYETLYLRLLRHLMLPRMTRYDRCRLDIAVEENSKISGQRVRGLVMDAYTLLVARNGRRPEKAPEVRIEKKTREPCLAVPDAFLGVLMAYARRCADERPPEALGLRFERLRDRYRMIFEQETATTYSRRRLFESWPNGTPPARKLA